MSKLLINTFALSLLIFIQTSSARTVGNPTPSPTPNSQIPHAHQKIITFLMRDIFCNIGTSSSASTIGTNRGKAKPSTTKFSSTSNSDIPFSKPLGIFPPKGAAFVPKTGLPSIGLPFTAKTTLQELELGVVTDIAEDVFNPNLGYKSQLLGKAEGMFVASSDDKRSHMMAMEVKLISDGDDGEGESGLRFFGVKKSDTNYESHIAVIGGVGKYKGANGYATVKRVEEKGRENKLLKFNVYLS